MPRQAALMNEFCEFIHLEEKNLLLSIHHKNTLSPIFLNALQLSDSYKMYSMHELNTQFATE